MTQAQFVVLWLLVGFLMFGDLVIPHVTIDEKETSHD
jgi:hypothetical protein